MNALDIGVLFGYLVLVLGLGCVLRVRGKSHVDFFLGGRRMGWWPIGLSVMVTVFSAINYVALPNEVFGHGLYVVAAFPVFFLAAWPVTRVWMPFFHNMQLTSVYEYFERRFDRRVRCLASGVFILWRLFWMATALYASGTILAALAGLPPVAVMLVGGLAATIYTSIGGMRAVMWTDVAQFCVLFGGLALGLVLATADGGLGDVIEVARAGGRLQPFVPFDPEFVSFSPFVRMTLWSALIGVFVAFLARYGADQVVMQRYFSARDLSSAQRGMWLNACVSVMALSLLVLFGLAVYAQAVKSGALDSIQWNALSAAERKGLAMRQLAVTIRSFPAGVTGLVAAGLLAATMSSIDSGVNACSAAYVTDFCGQRTARRNNGVAMGLGLDRVVTLCLGAMVTCLALALIPLVGRTNSLFMIVNKLINGLGSPLLALFLLGMFTRWANGPGMFIGGLAGFAAALLISLRVHGLALQYYAAVNLTAALVPCCACSFLCSALGHPSTPEQRQWTWRAWRRRRRAGGVR